MARTPPKRPTIETFKVGAAAIDIGSKMHMAAVNPDATDMPVQAFGTVTRDLIDLAVWFKSHGVTSVAMESTSVYWIPAYEILEQRGFEVILVKARYAKNVPNWRTDVSDVGCLRQLHSYGLLRGSFRPSAGIAALRTICANESGWWNTLPLTFGTCKRRYTVPTPKPENYHGL